MNPPHRDDGTDPTAQELFADVLAGHRTLDDPAVRRACEDPAFRRRLEALLAVQAQIDRIAAAEATVANTPPAPLDARIAQGARDQLRARPAPLRLWRIILTLAAVLVVGAGVYLAWPASKPVDHRLGNQGQPGAHELRVDANYAAVHWQGERGRFLFQVRVLDRDRKEIERSDTLDTNTWTPPRRDYPDEVLIEVWLVDSAAEPIESKPLASQVFGRDGTPR